MKKHFTLLPNDRAALLSTYIHHESRLLVPLLDSNQAPVSPYLTETRLIDQQERPSFDQLFQLNLNEVNQQRVFFSRIIVSGGNRYSIPSRST
jgi:hypothetical protein